MGFVVIQRMADCGNSLGETACLSLPLLLAVGLNQHTSADKRPVAQDLGNK